MSQDLICPPSHKRRRSRPCYGDLIVNPASVLRSQINDLLIHSLESILGRKHEYVTRPAKSMHKVQPALESGVVLSRACRPSHGPLSVLTCASGCREGTAVHSRCRIRCGCPQAFGARPNLTRISSDYRRSASKDEWKAGTWIYGFDISQPISVCPTNAAVRGRFRLILKD